MARALIVDDDRDSLDAMSAIVTQIGFQAVTAEDLSRARTALSNAVPDVALIDVQLPDGSGLELLPSLAESTADVVLITGHATLDSAVEALRGGAADYLTKPVDTARLQRLLQEIHRRIKMREEISSLRSQLRDLGRFERFVGSSRLMHEVYDLISKVAPTEASVLVTGETGTGKELVAHTIHDLSPRADKPFVAINCGAVPKDLIGAELFGHEKGAFTGAARTRSGYFERAHGGTLFLDEIAEMPPEQQVNLLRVLETKTLSRIGGDEEIAVDVRLIAATNRDPRKAVEEGILREDLMYRLMAFPIPLPPLRDREDDVRMLAQHVMAELNQANGAVKEISDAAMDKIRRYSWPGNVRELKNVLQRAWIMANEEIRPEDVPVDVGLAPPGGANGAVVVSIGSSIAQAEKQLILATLEHVAGDKARASEILGISVKTLYNRLSAYRGV